VLATYVDFINTLYFGQSFASERRREGLGNREGRVGARCVERRWWFEKLDDEGIGEERVWSCEGFCGLEGGEEGFWFCHF
jgi:hypothetical protein